MLIIPEIETVFILPPRTGSGTLYRTALERYPRAMLLYRHMEADGCPQGYDRWRRVGFVRHPLARLWSLHQFMGTWERGEAATERGKTHCSDTQTERRRIQAQGNRDFEDWLLHNNDGFTVPVSVRGTNEVWPILARRDPAPENRRSQFSYLRPDLGVEVFKFENYAEVLKEFGLAPSLHKNQTKDKKPIPELSVDAAEYLTRLCEWDYEQNCALA